MNSQLSATICLIILLPSMLICSSKEEKLVQYVTGNSVCDKVWDATFARADKYLDWLHEQIVDSRPVHKFSEWFLDNPSIPHLQPYADIVGGLCCGALAFRYRASLSKHVTWRNAACAASVVYFSNKLLPDGLKDFLKKIPLVGLFIDSRRFRNYRVVKNCHGKIDTIYPARSSSFALTEYALGAGLLYGARNHISRDTVCYAAIASWLVGLISPKCIVVKIPIVRRLFA